MVLAPRQYLRMCQNPDLILQFSHHLAQLYRTKKGREIQVFVKSRAGLNGRAAEVLIDPEVDLARVPRTPWNLGSWVKPLTAPLPPPGEIHWPDGDW